MTKRLFLVVTLCLLAAAAVHAEEPGVCAMPALGFLPEPMPMSCPCLPGGSFNCSGTGSTCSAAQSSFFSDCDAEADLVCWGLDGTCNFSIISQDPCVWDGSQYVVTGRARTRCLVCA